MYFITDICINGKTAFKHSRIFQSITEIHTISLCCLETGESVTVSYNNFILNYSDFTMGYYRKSRKSSYYFIKLTYYEAKILQNIEFDKEEYLYFTSPVKLPWEGSLVNIVDVVFA